MNDTTHLRVYQRFFAVTASVLPGLNLVLGLAALLLFLLCDVGGLEWGWGIGIAAAVMTALFSGWIFIGASLQRWAEQQATGKLAGISAPFILADVVLLIWLFIESVVFASMPGGEESALRTAEAALSLLA